MTYRTHNCGELSEKNIGNIVYLSGWISSKRNFGNILFLDLRDRYGITQIKIEEAENKKDFLLVNELNKESVVKCRGIVKKRENPNPKIPTGNIEIISKKIEVLSSSSITPFTIIDNTDGGEELLAKYRYLDLRRNKVKNNIILRHKLCQNIRNYLSSKDFLEIETPYLIKSTPEGARDFLVPSRINKGNFYSLPQSPQLYKQLLMVSGFDRYFQIVKCFRDEDFRADRQPEFTQIDCEMSFVNQEDVMNIFEDMITYLFKSVVNIELPKFKKISYKEALNIYGSDKPDLRYNLKINDLSEKTKKFGFKVFDEAEFIGAITLSSSEADTSFFSRKQIDKLTEYCKSAHIGAKGLIYVKYNSKNNIKSSVDKFFTPHNLKDWFNKPKNGDIMFVLSGEKKETLKQLGRLRTYLANIFKLTQNNKFEPLWVIDFPMFEQDEETKELHAMHHPFTSYIEDSKKDIKQLRAKAYDMVINGSEIGGGSIRINNLKTQKRVFEILGMQENEYNDKFGFILEAFKYGVPPHGGIAFGLDRICSVMTNQQSIKDFIAFPKNNSGKDLMTVSPSKVEQQQLKELGIMLLKE